MNQESPCLYTGECQIGTGDAREPQISQDVDSLAGKILRLTPEGKVPADNPFPNNPVFITGIRNTQGFDWYNPSTLFVTDHGPSGELGRRGEDKVSVLQAGDNMGWPAVENCEAEAEFVRPSLVWREAAPPGGAAIYTGDAIPEWKGNLIIGVAETKYEFKCRDVPWNVSTGVLTSSQILFILPISNA
ncbi:PQQ-dependent sugar dehydrogenase [Microcystis aeruginosa CS-567/02-A1]|uniref:PQQ-dependent sugar dehydrogenase n=1 Tax=Microcystis aeruginosa TaxID=1126 RepID=UPI00232E0E9F|nr:PQQ-dependent sugar dehydrogenase [Microcystis aeruginosa]MDB9400829.1 PQQ-dependent sugar dehydrogenase [Microcystis aeruginosa CS-567/02-A1]